MNYKLLKLNLCDLFIKTGESRYLKASQLFTYLFHYPSFIDDVMKKNNGRIQIYYPGLRYIYHEKFPKELEVRIKTKGKLPEVNMIDDEIYDIYKIDDDKINKFDFIEMTLDNYVECIKNSMNIKLIEPSLEYDIELVFLSDIYYDPFTDSVINKDSNIPDPLDIY